MKRLAETIKPYLQLLRIGNLAFIAILLYTMEKWVATPLLQAVRFQEQMPWWVLTLLIIGTVLIAAGGYVINDYFDVKIDKINRPDRLIVIRHITRDGAMRLFQVFSIVGVAAGMAVAWWARSWTLAMVFIVIPGLLWFYSASYKRQLLVGNIIVAFVSALVPLLVAIVNADYLRSLYGEALVYTPITGQLYVWLSGFALFAFLITLVREMVKDIEDIHGDQEMECRTMPIVWGVTTTKVIATVLLVVTTALIGYIAFLVLPFPHTWQSLSTRYIVFGLATPILCAIALLWASKTPLEYHRTQLIIKFVMFMGMLYSFVIYQSLHLTNLH
ncbi:MAG: geranylgeranylglycerol-phosphate geranylgeranyltransferase [Paludibacteraceae bacterium]|nr:geranylgeranylglycerol-phosphate geranylgeranyltransferase [Paludibacteraceae bacterium]